MHQNNTGLVPLTLLRARIPVLVDIYYLYLTNSLIDSVLMNANLHYCCRPSTSDLFGHRNKLVFEWHNIIILW